MPSADELEVLVSRARSVTQPELGQRAPMSARDVARELAPVIRTVANAHGASEMRQACAWLSRAIWPTSGKVAVPMTCKTRGPILAVARALAERAGYANVRDALAFWASETDPAVWQGVVSAAA